MKLIRVEMRDFRSYPKVKIDFRNHQLIRIRGRNGVGKSAILESLSWAIFRQLRGKSSIRDATRRLSQHDERSRPQQTDRPRVGWIVEIDGNEYRVARWKGNAQVEDVSRHRTVTGSRRVARFMIEQLGIEYDDLRATAWCLQDDVMRPVSMVKEDRRRLIRRLLLDDRDSSAAIGTRDAKPKEAVREARKQVEKAGHQLEEAIENLKKVEEKESRTRHRLDSLREKWQATLEQRSRHRILIAEMASAERERESLRHHLEACAKHLRATREMEARVGRFDSAVLDWTVAQLEDKLFELDCLDTALQDTRDERLTKRVRADTGRDWYNDVAETLATAIAKSECPTCERRLWTGHATLLEKRDRANAETGKLRLQADRARTPAEEETEYFEDFRRVAGEVDALQDRVRKLQYEDGYCDAARATLSHLQSEATKHAELEAAVADTVKRLEKYRRDEDDLDYCEEEYECLKADLGQTEVEWRKVMEEARELRTRRDGLGREYRQRVQAAMAISAEAVGMDVQEEEVRSGLEGRMNEIVTTLTRGEDFRRPLSVSISEDFRPTLHEDNGKGPTVSSGGLDVVVALAMRLALMRLVAEKHDPHASPLGGVFILDEPFGNVDARWREKFLDLLKSGEWCVNQIVEISSWDRTRDATKARRRNDDSQETSGFEREGGETIYTVRMANGESVVTG